MLEVFLATSDHWDGPWWGGIVFLLFFVLILCLVFFKLFWWRPWRWRGSWTDSPDEILKRRLASGQITEAEYRHLHDVLRAPGSAPEGGN
jgi:uncharacterized membrane protein